MKINLSLLAILSLLAPAMAGTTVDDSFAIGINWVDTTNAGLKNEVMTTPEEYRFCALRFTSDANGGELDSIILSKDGTESGEALNLTGASNVIFTVRKANQTGMNLYFDGTGTTTITGVKLNNGKTVDTKNVTNTYYAFVVASGTVEFDNVSGTNDTAIDLQQNLSVGTAWTNYSETPAELKIQNGSKIATTAAFNTIGANGSKGIITVTDQGTEFKTQRITLGGGTEGMYYAPNNESYRESTGISYPLAYYGQANNYDSLYWFPAYLYSKADYDGLVSSGVAKGYGILNIKNGATTTIGEGNTSSSSNLSSDLTNQLADYQLTLRNKTNSLQIFNGEVNVEGTGSQLKLSSNVLLTMSPLYKDTSGVAGLKSSINVRDGGVVGMVDGAKLDFLSMGLLANEGNEVEASFNVSGEGSRLSLAASRGMYIGGSCGDASHNESGLDVSAYDYEGKTKTSLNASGKGGIELASDSNIQLGAFGTKSTNEVAVKAESGGTVEMTAANNIFVGNNASLAASLEATGEDSKLLLKGTHITVNDKGSSDHTTLIKVTDGATMEMSATELIRLYKNTTLSLEENATLITKAGNGYVEFAGEGSQATIDATSTWNASSIRLQEAAELVNYGTLACSTSFALGEGTVLTQYGTFSVAAASAGSANSMSFGAGSETRYKVTGSLNDNTLTSTTVQLDKGVSLEVIEGCRFTLDFTSTDILAPGEYVIDKLVLIEGIDDAYLLDDAALSTLLSNTSFEFVRGLQVATDSPLQYYNGSGVLYLSGTLYVTPEPTTATLSLLALAALAARRRRKG